MGKGCGNGCILTACGILAAFAFGLVEFAVVGEQAYARYYAYTAPIEASESAALVGGMNVVALVLVVGFVVLGGMWAAWRRHW